MGTGKMGTGIAYASVVAGFDTVLNDITTEFLDQALRNITGFLDAGVERGKIQPEQKKAALARLKLEQDLTAAVGGAGLVIEAVPEDIGLSEQDRKNDGDSWSDACRQPIRPPSKVECPWSTPP